MENKKLSEDINKLMKDNNLDGVILIGFSKEDKGVSCNVIGDMCELAQMMKFATDENKPLREVFEHTAKHAIMDLIEQEEFHKMVKMGKVARA